MRQPIRIGGSVQIEAPLIQIDAGDTVEPGYGHIGSQGLPVLSSYL